MAQSQVQKIELVQGTFSCAVCLDLLKDPVTTSCGHSYCRECLQHHWNVEEEKRVYSCPQCRRTFRPRPVLEKNTMLAALMETLEKTGLQAEETTVRQRELEETRQKIQQSIQHREKDLNMLQMKVESIKSSAEKATKDSKDIFTQMICLLEKRLAEVQQQVRSMQEAEVNRVKELQKKLEQEMTELKRRDAELEKISHTLDHSQFLHKFSLLSALSPLPDSTSMTICPLRYFEDVTAAVSQLRDEILRVLMGTPANNSQTVRNVDVLLPELQPEPEPFSRWEFLRYSRQITLDPNTVNKHLLLSKENRKARYTGKVQSYSDHPDRFTDYYQVLSKESLTGRCYWEVEIRGLGYGIGVTYKNISRAGKSFECAFGLNKKSWILSCSNFRHDSIKTIILSPGCSKVGIYLDHTADLLSFYRVLGTMDLFYRARANFIQPLHVGLWVGSFNSSVELMNL
ncbi:tripartite motif-containing protein 16-like protein [Nelusetta ayraudi]|uniref:tripartite motif-containing protein 16-like protein n=1 Tax=Nelusetta ayraudi TaxID=303726 RepID=UPI003F6F434D